MLNDGRRCWRGIMADHIVVAAVNLQYNWVTQVLLRVCEDRLYFEGETICHSCLREVHLMPSCNKTGGSVDKFGCSCPGSTCCIWINDCVGNNSAPRTSAWRKSKPIGVRNRCSYSDCYLVLSCVSERNWAGCATLMKSIWPEELESSSKRGRSFEIECVRIMLWLVRGLNKSIWANNCWVIETCRSSYSIVDSWDLPGVDWTTCVLGGDISWQDKAIIRNQVRHVLWICRCWYMRDDISATTSNSDRCLHTKVSHSWKCCLNLKSYGLR